MKVIVSSKGIDVGAFVIIDKGQLGGRHVKDVDSDAFVYITAGSRGRVVSCSSEWAEVKLSQCSVTCQVQKSTLTPVRNLSPSQMTIPHDWLQSPEFDLD